MRRNRLLLVGAALLTCAACSGGAQPVKVHGPPASTPAVHLARLSALPSAPGPSNSGPLCAMSRPSAGNGGGPLITVDRDPVSVRITWIPGMNAKRCVVSETTGTTRQARQLAKDIRSAPKVKHGAYNCPADDGTAVRLVFGYGRGKAWELALVSLTGCSSIRGPGRDARWSTTELTTDLRPLAPPAWRGILGR